MIETTLLEIRWFYRQQMNKSSKLIAAAIALAMTALMLFLVISFTGLMQAWFASLTPQKQYWLPKALLLLPVIFLPLGAFITACRARRTKA
jgi:hypothetical protein